MTLETTLRGAFFRPAEAQALVTALEPGTTVYFQPEPENPHDPYAVRVLHYDGENYHHIGYVAKEDAPLISTQWPEDREILPASLEAPVGDNPLIRKLIVELE